MCDCRSGNCPETGGSIPSLVVTVPKALRTDRTTITIDPCIAEAVAVLWSLKITTHSNCCGHNGLFPRHIVIDEVNYMDAREKLNEREDWRDICLSFWRGDKRLDDIIFISPQTKCRRS